MQAFVPLLEAFLKNLLLRRKMSRILPMSYASFFAGKRVTQLGLGLLGRGIKDADFLARHVEHLTVTDKKSAQDLATSVQALAHHQNITFVLGEHRLEDFESPDFVLKAAGVPLDSPYIAHAREKGYPGIHGRVPLFASRAADAGHRRHGNTRQNHHHLADPSLLGAKHAR
jgi:hypothetical protein